MFWSQNSLLNSYNQYTNPKDIFDEVGCQLGEYFKQYGCKYSKVSHKLTKTTDLFTVEVVFWSSRLNEAGKTVLMELKTNYYYRKSKKTTKRKGNFCISDGFINTIDGHALTRKIHYIDGSVNTLEHGAEERYGNTLDVYGIDEELFGLLLSYIQSQFDFLEVLLNKDRLIRHIRLQGKFRRRTLAREEFSFLEFFKDYHGEDEELNQLMSF